MFIGGWMDKDVVSMCVYIGILFGHGDETNVAICNNMDGS